MKRSAVFAVLAVVLSAVCAFGAVQDFGRFTIDVPSGWTATQDGSTVGIVKNDNTASMSITIDSTEGASLKDIAEEFSKAFSGTKPEKDSDGDFSFDFTNQNGVSSHCIVTSEEGEYALLVLTGLENAPDDMSAILGSFNMK